MPCQRCHYRSKRLRSCLHKRWQLRARRGSSLIAGQASGFGPIGTAAGGCLASANQGGRCDTGAGNALSSYTGEVPFRWCTTEAGERCPAGAVSASLVAGGSAVLLLPAALSAAEATGAWLGRGLIFGALVDTLRRFQWVLSTNGAGGDKPTSPAYPGNDPTVPPPDYEWRGRPGSKPGDKEGNYVNPGTGESLRPDLDHLPPVGPHWDHRDTDGNWGRLYPDGKRVPK